MRDDQKVSPLVVPNRELVLPDGQPVDHMTSKQRKEAQKQEEFMRGYPTRREVQGVVVNIVNDAINSMIGFFLDNFEMTAKTDEARKMLEDYHKAKEGKQDGERAEALDEAGETHS